ncbi:MAG TPA: fused MFS/spermidine synthase [Labilithrix sp.]
MTFRLTRVAPLLFFSGLCALVYEVAWFRELRLIFGASTAASAAVLAVFMGGLGAGGAYFGRRLDAAKNALATYANLELGVALTAAATPLLVVGADRVYIGAGGSTALGTSGATLLRLVLSVVILGVPTFLMGGTLPAAARAVEREGDPERRRVATLYGVNTFGAVVGAVATNFVLLEVLGTRITLWCAALLNALVGVTARSFARRDGGEGATATAESLASESASEPAVAEAFPWFPPVAALLAGFAFMLMELVWYRMLAPILGGSSYTFGLILAVALVGVGAGGALYAKTRAPSTLLGFATTCSLEAVFIAIPYALGDRIAILAAGTRGLARLGFGESVGVWTAIAVLVVLPASIVAGLQFPLVIGLYGRGARDVGRHVGRAYVANTAGSIVGSLAGGFGLMPLLGAPRCWRLVVFSLAAGAVLAIALDVKRRGAVAMRLVTSIAPVAACAALLAAHGPGSAWRHSGIGAGRADLRFRGFDADVVRDFLRDAGRGIRWERDGVESSVALSQNDGFAFIVNGKSDGHSIIDASTQVMSGLIPAMLLPNAKAALVIGLGTGSTAGWLGRVPTIDKVDVVELEPAILDVARDCAPVNEHVLDNPKVHVTLADAREALRTSRERYDLVFSEPSNPYRAGISSLWTVEFYRAAAERLQPSGIFAQWVQAYEVDAWTLATAIVTMKQVFPDVTVWETEPGDLLLIGRRTPVPIDVDIIRTRIAMEPFSRGAAAAFHTDVAEGVLAHFVANGKLADVLVERGMGGTNTDDQNLLEFAFARSVGMRKNLSEDVWDLAERLHVDRPAMIGEVDWERVHDQRWLFRDFADAPPVPALAARPNAELGPFLARYESGAFPLALKAWEKLGREPSSLHERAIVAELAARVGEGKDVELLDGMHEPAAHDLLLAVWLGRHGDGARAVESLRSGFARLRTFPWVQHKVVASGIALAVEIATREPRFAPALYDALREPFAVEWARDERMAAAARIATLAHDDACVDAFDALEPVPWNSAVLSARARCLANAKDPRADAAQADLVAFLDHHASFGATIPTPKPQTPPSPPAPPSGDAAADAPVDSR